MQSRRTTSLTRRTRKRNEQSRCAVSLRASLSTVPHTGKRAVVLVFDVGALVVLQAHAQRMLEHANWGGTVTGDAV